MLGYDENSIIAPNFPVLSQLQDRTWQQVWEIQLSAEQDVELDLKPLQEHLSNHEIKVRITKNDKTLYVEVTTIRWALEDDLIGHSWRMLEILNENIEGIATIQGQHKALWIRSLRADWLRSLEGKADKNP
jgi:hypothetical protein